MPCRYCGSYRSPLHADDGHRECVSCLGKSHADAALAGSDCSHCESISLASLRTRIAFFSGSDPALRALPFSFSQGPVRKKQRGRGSQRPVESELTPTQIPRASLSPHREISPVLFDPAPSGLPAPSAAKAGMDAELFRVLSKAVEELGLEWSPPEEPSRSHLDEWFLPGRRQAPQQRPSPFFPEVHDELTRSWRSPYSAASILPLHLPSLGLTALKKRDMRGCLNWMSQWLHISAHPLPSAGRRKPVTRPSHAGPLQRSLDAPTLQLDRRLRRSTLWRFFRSIRPSSSLP